MGRLLGIARAEAKRAPLKEVAQTEVDIAEGLAGDVRGAKRDRQVTVLFREGWEAACGELSVTLPWIIRRANLLIEGMAAPREGARLGIGDLVLEVTGETKPCSVMEAAQPGLRAALKPQWRGGVCCRVVQGGAIRIGDDVRLA